MKDKYKKENLGMVRVRYKNKERLVKNGTILSDAIRLMEEKIETPCNCLGICKKCQIKVRGDLSPKEKIEENLPKDVRLACITMALGDVEIFKLTDSELKIHEEVVNLDIDIEEQGKVLAIDVGTTGVSARLIDLDEKRITGNYSGLNYQSEYGADVLSRITYCIQNDVLDLQNAILSQIRDIIKKVGTVDRIAIAGNTTMQHLIYGENPKSLAISPYEPVFLEEKSFFIDGIETTLLSNASSYVGADIVSGVAVIKLEENNNTLFIDIGTNGEMVLSIDGKLHETSTAAGPAFEGMNIECGMRAGNGAIEGFEIVETGKFKMKTIGETPTGICGSGLLDIMSEFVKHKIVLKSGRFNPRMKPEFQEKLRDKKFYISENIYLSQGDIRQIQLAKGAIAAGVKLLLLKVEKDISDMEEVIIAGSFGYHLNVESILNIGLISDFNGKITFAGNTSLNGCIGYLVNKKVREKIRTTKIDVMELSKSAKFQEVFIKELAF
ncbi:ASKHA domain-containing protein [Psychrilyobacter sp.]|uniref:ASKHA domain-containing protein n=1 Tax=Psychrilyobacter sp. TaxID=2586924 RepID=UPI00301952A0